MGDEEGEVKLYAYVGARAEGESTEVTAGEDPKVLTQTVTLLGAREGDGEASFPNGDAFKGSFASGKRSGSGTYTYAAPAPEEGEDPKPPVATYEGTWRNGNKSGVGVMTYDSGAKYQGTFAGGKYAGQGTMFYANGDIYTGEWVGGKKDGTGTYIYKASGAKVTGLWKMNVLQTGSFTDKFGSVYKGTFAATATSASFVAGGEFTLCSGAVTPVPVAPGALVFGELVMIECVPEWGDSTKYLCEVKFELRLSLRNNC